MNNVVFSEKIQFVPHRRQITYLLQRPATLCYVGFEVLTAVTMDNVRFEVFTAVTMKNGVFWDATQCGSCKNRRFGT
jgi:hypothetical protein